VSRIRDALRRAEQEKGKAPGREATAAAPVAAPAAVPAPAGPQVSGSAAAIAAATAAQPVSPPPSPRPTGAVSSPGLLESCRRPLWLGDSSKLLFLGSAGHTFATEQLRNLRSRLSAVRAERALKSVVITSAGAAEGKTYLAANLAHAFARQHDRKILLVDADLRRAGLHSLLGAPAEPGLSDYLCGRATEEQILQRGPQESLFFIPGGKAAANPGELLSGGKVKILLSRLAPLFDWILLDTPPVADAEGESAALPDARMIARHCDGVLLVIQAGATRRQQAQRAVREFPSERLLGVVLNRAQVPEKLASRRAAGSN